MARYYYAAMSSQRVWWEHERCEGTHTTDIKAPAKASSEKAPSAYRDAIRFADTTLP